MTEWGRKRYITPGRRDRRRADHDRPRRDQPDDPDPARLARTSTSGRTSRRSSTAGSARQPGRQEPPVEQGHAAQAAEARLHRQVHAGSCRRASTTSAPTRTSCCDTGGGPFARQWCTAKAGLVDFGYAQGDRALASRWCCRARRTCPRWSSSGRCRRSRTRSSATAPAPTTRPTAALIALHCLERAMKEVQAGRTKSWNELQGAREAVSCGFHEAARGVLSHHMVIRDGKIANYQPYPPTPWNASPRDVYGTPGPVRGRGAEHADLRGERPGELQGHRHHAGGALVRPVPAVRRAHVHRRRQGAQGRAHARRRWPSEMAPTTADSGRRVERAARARRRSCRRARGAGDPATRELAEELVGRGRADVRRRPRADRATLLERRRRTAQRIARRARRRRRWSPACC